MIEIKGLTKKYGKFCALDDLNLTLSGRNCFWFCRCQWSREINDISHFGDIATADNRGCVHQWR